MKSFRETSDVLNETFRDTAASDIVSTPMVVEVDVWSDVVNENENVHENLSWHCRYCVLNSDTLVV